MNADHLRWWVVAIALGTAALMGASVSSDVSAGAGATLSAPDVAGDARLIP